MDMSSFAQLLGEFDDQDGVLAGKADEHDQADLAVDVVFLAADGLGADGAENRQRNGQQHDERQREAFVLRRQSEIDDQDAESEEQNHLAAGLQFFQRESGPIVHEASRQSGAARRASTVAMAWPELTPGAAEPSTVAERNRL